MNGSNFFFKNETDTTITVDVVVGADIAGTSHEAANLAHVQKKVVEFDFNGVKLRATPESNGSDLAGEYNAEIRRRSDAYWTPERKAEKLAKEKADKQALGAHIVALDGVNLVDWKAALCWLCRLEELAMVHTPYDQVVARFRRAGWDVGGGSRKGEESTEDWARRVGAQGQIRWLIGQALDGVERIGAPHGVIHKFARDLGVFETGARALDVEE